MTIHYQKKLCGAINISIMSDPVADSELTSSVYSLILYIDIKTITKSLRHLLGDQFPFLTENQYN